eukprot:TRINITY_DN87456_c0_g1_i1.p1 TRINITY_DN87456_c0_g1~~TRINITY_DN87456_c0_g1_i1.p1  ORF type:complete len:478 (+),score=68.04 TRINITY_DN87456_c0_g1_i1:56-1435(+)
MATSHFHDSSAVSQNLGNSLGSRPCVRQTPLYRRHESGNAMKDILGMNHLVWQQEESPSNNEMCNRKGKLSSQTHEHPNMETPPPRDRARSNGYPQTTPAPLSPPQLCAELHQPRGGKQQSNVAMACHKGGYPASQPPRSSSSICLTPADDDEGSRCALRACQPPRSSNGSFMTPAAEAEGVRCDQRASQPPRSSSSSCLTRPVEAKGSKCAQRASQAPRSSSSSRLTTPAKAEDGRCSQRSESVPAGQRKISTARFDSMHKAPAFGSQPQRKTKGEGRQIQGGRSLFIREYERGALPCRIEHRTCSYRVFWHLPPEDLESLRKELMPLFAEGLRERQHPYATLARLAFGSLAQLPGAAKLSDTSMREVMMGIRQAFTSCESEDVCLAAMAALRELAQAEGQGIAAHLPLVLPSLGRHFSSGSARQRDAAKELIRSLGELGGEYAKKAIRARSTAAGLA